MTDNLEVSDLLGLSESCIFWRVSKGIAWANLHCQASGGSHNIQDLTNPLPLPLSPAEMQRRL